LLFLGDQALGNIQSVEHLTLFVYRCFRAVEVLGSFVVVVELSRPKSDYFTAEFADRPDQPAAEPVVDSPVSLGDESAGE